MATKRRQALYWCAALCALSVAVRLPFLHVPWITDEGGAAYVARFWSDEHQLYRDINYDRLQGFFLLYKLWFRLFGETVAAVRLGAALTNAGTLVGVYLIANEVSHGSHRTGVVAAGLFALLSPLPAIEGFTANAEAFASLPLTLAALASWRRRWVGAGMLAGAAVLIKPIGVSGWLLAAAWLTVRERPRLTAFTRLSAAFLVPVAAACGHASVTVGFEHLWRTFVTQRAMAYSAITDDASVQWARLTSGFAGARALWGPGLLLALPAAFRWPMADGHRFWLFWLVSTFAGMAMGGNWFAHYFIQAVPVVAVGAALGCRALANWRPALRLAYGSAVVAIFAVPLRGQVNYWSMSPDEVSWQMYHRPAYLAADEIGAVVQAHSDPDDTLYVAFSEAHLYFVADRRAAVPQQLFWRQVAYNQGIWQRVLTAIEQRDPAIVYLGGRPPWGMSLVQFRARLRHAGYQPIQAVGSGRLFRREAAAREVHGWLRGGDRGGGQPRSLGPPAGGDRPLAELGRPPGRDHSSRR
ncbi:MAG: hypothetical protein B7733_17955 [Myxococcales bacterium FL481]|nr:MAG: hypothetical protein B7733_17955 [Myxococcales bacterium FL481]